MPEGRIELPTYPLPRGCATTTLLRHPLAQLTGIGPSRAAINEEGDERKMSEARNHAKDVRRGKLEAALKENLRRRKAQSRARKALEKDKNPQETTKGSHSGRDLV